jgi:beta-galactosidase
MYVPAPVTRAGTNAVVVLELENLTEPCASFVAAPFLGETEE